MKFQLDTSNKQDHSTIKKVEKRRTKRERETDSKERTKKERETRGKIERKKTLS